MSILELSREITDRYRQYLHTTFYFRDPNLRESFVRALRAEELVKGPYLEGSPAFLRGRTPRQLFTELGLTPDDGFLAAIEGDRPLYKHQEEAIRRTVQGRNVVVATGTGSGKTESFLLPILFHLYCQYRADQLGPGVRALILYPMNALANDQRDRLGQISERLEKSGSGFRFTFGQYTGETPEDERDNNRHAGEYEHNRRPGELVFRSEMRTSPPHILLTNYSMLEYLLIRPDDSPLFDGGVAKWWSFLVLDEAHQYRGTRGIEMAMLLRRLKQRLREGGRRDRLHCIATSASLLEGEKHRPVVCDFASALFGNEPFIPDDVILGSTQSLPESGRYQLKESDYELIYEALQTPADATAGALAALANRLGVNLPRLPADEQSAQVAAGVILSEDQRAALLRRRMLSGPLAATELADVVFPDAAKDQRLKALDTLVSVLSLASDASATVADPALRPPLLSPRYHLILRSLEGAFISYLPRPTISISRQGSTEAASFEIALCRECGQHYLVGRIEGGSRVGYLKEAVRDPGSQDFGAFFFKPWDTEHLGEGEEEEGEDLDEDAMEAGRHSTRATTVYQLCVRCGAIWIDGSTPHCDHGTTIKVLRESASGANADRVRHCSTCGHKGTDPVREVVHGTDGPNAVIATALYAGLPEDRRKILAFADGRQDAAFFAWYLDHSYEAVLYRHMILSTAAKLQAETSGGVSLADLAQELPAALRQYDLVSPGASELQVKREVWRALFREFMSDQRRTSLEGLGLGFWFVQWPDWFKIPAVLLQEPWRLHETQAESLLQLLLNTMRTGRAVELETGGPSLLVWEDLGIQYPQHAFRIGSSRSQKGISAWDGPRGGRTRFLSKLLVTRGMDEEDAREDAIRTLQEIWKALRALPSSVRTQDGLLLQSRDAARLNPVWWRFRAITDASELLQCGTCGGLCPRSLAVLDLCPKPACPGRLVPVKPGTLDGNHYRTLYQIDLPGRLRVEEHTAQLSHQKAHEFQQDFKEGRIHVLSCSTTFELGVDLGDLDTVFLRNVPPEAFNYAQRVGRAGRRPGRPGFAITYCRRSPHDLYHFAAPERMLSGTTRPFPLKLANQKIVARHMTAVALSYFFRFNRDRFRNVGAFVGDPAQPRITADLRTFLQSHRTELEAAWRAIIPAEIQEEMGLVDGRWIESIAGTNTGSRLAQAELELANDYKKVREAEEEFIRRKRYHDADWANRRAATLEKEDVLSFLSRKVVIPKYGFPVDVVELDTQSQNTAFSAQDVQLQRDLGLAIAEFAPTSKVVAAKKLWTSYGLKTVAERSWPIRYYRKCLVHNRFDVWSPGENEPGERCCKHMSAPMKYIIPQFGFVTGREGPGEPTSRPERMFSTRPFFVSLVGSDHETVGVPRSAPTPLIRVTKTSPGQMGIICEGKGGNGFYICQLCGAGLLSPCSEHKNPLGRPCRGKLESYMLGHEFTTDVLLLSFLPRPELPEDGACQNALIWFGYSLAFALVGGASEVLEVPPTDISTTVGHADEASIPPIVLYDNVPGGAGLVARLEDERTLLWVVEAAYRRVNGRCGCGEDDSCYGCLRNYGNQFAHTHLRRGPVKAYLERLLELWGHDVQAQADVAAAKEV